MNIKKIAEAENDPEKYFRGESLYWWTRYVRNRQIIKQLRKNNRRYRQLLTQLLQE